MTEGDYPLLTANELAEAGRALYGAAWRGRLAEALEVAEAELALVESGAAPAPAAWRPKLIALAQDIALRAMETASELLWREAGAAESAAARYSSPRLV